MQCYDLVMHHCNLEDNARVMKIFEDIVKEFINNYVKDDLFDKSSIELLVNPTEVWEKLVIFASLMERLFRYLNNNYLRNVGQPKISE